MSLSARPPPLPGTTPGPLGRRVLRAVAFAALLGGLAAAAPLARAAPGVSEEALKAAFVERFAAFTTWPEDALPPAGPLVLCVLGDSRLRGPLEETARQRPIQHRPVRVRLLGPTSPVSACHVLFLPGSARDGLAKTLEAVSGRPILTIGDSEGFGRRGVMINMIREGQYIRFEINRLALEKARLRLSAKVLRLGREVKTP